MPALSSLVLTDRKTTPVAHTFTPDGKPDGVGVLVESNGMKLADSRFTINHRKTTNGRWKVTLKLEVPKVVNETINGVSIPRVARIAYATVDFSFAGDSETAERNDIVGMTATALAKSATVVDKTVVDLEDIW